MTGNETISRDMAPQVMDARSRIPGGQVGLPFAMVSAARDAAR